MDSFGSTRRQRQLTAREEGSVRLEKIGSASAVAQVIQQQADKAQEEGLTREQVWGRCGAGGGPHSRAGVGSNSHDGICLG